MKPLQQSTPSTKEQRTPRTMSAVVLAGRLRPATLHQSIDVHVLCLPVGRRGTLLEAWLATLRDVPEMQQVRVVVNTEQDAAAVRAVLPREPEDAPPLASVEVMAEPASWRGAAGLVRDVTERLADDAVILVCEGRRLPPPSLDPVLIAIEGTESEPVAGVVGVCGDDNPAGVYAFRRKALQLVPRVGYCDLKEQFLPSLSKAGQPVVTARLSDEIWRLSDLEGYLSTVRCSLADSSAAPESMLRVSPRASVSGSAILDGFCIIEPGAVVEDGAVVHDSVVLWGATVGGGAVVSRSVVGPLASVDPRARAIRAVVTRNGHAR